VTATSGKWKIDGARVRELRMAKMMTIPELATKAGIGPRTLSDVELGTKAARPDTIRCLAGALEVEPAMLEANAARKPTATPSAPAAPAIPIPPPKHPPRTRLDSLADLVRTRGLSPPPVTIGKAKLAVLDPVVMQNLFARHAAFDGDSFVVCGRIERQRALSVAEARALKTRVGVGARYGLVVDVAATETLDVTVHAVDATVAAALQAKMGQAARVVVRVRVVGTEEARVVSLFASARKRAWALVAAKIV
jgi:transcriptional regulator with XRE-family HTH domain